jgi:hypothetical protein
MPDGMCILASCPRPVQEPTPELTAGPGIVVGGHHGDVDARQAPGDGLEDPDELRKVLRQVDLLVDHRIRVVDQKQQIEVAVDLDRQRLALDPTLLGIELGERAIEAAGQNTGRGEEQARRSSAAHEAPPWAVSSIDPRRGVAPS